MAERDWAKELADACKAEDWELHAKIWEERRMQAVDDDEASIADDPLNNFNYVGSRHHY